MKQQPLFVISGEQGGGKTTLLKLVVKELIREKIALDGFLAIGEWENNLRSGFSIENLRTGESKVLCVDYPKKDFEQVGRFYFNPITIQFGEKILCPSDEPGQLKVIDEIGLFELKGKVWADVFKNVINSRKYPILLTVRENFLKQVITHFKIENYFEFDLTQKPNDIASQIINILR